MRILQCYRFLIGTKLPFDKWPGIVERFLHDQDLTHRAFHYYLECYDDQDRYRAVLDGTKCATCGASENFCDWCRNNAANALRKGTGCERAAREHPFLGPIHVREDRYTTHQSLNNFSDPSNDHKERIYAILSKIYRRYGFAETSLIYRDIDFFTRRGDTPAPSDGSLLNGYAGPGITLCRSCNSKANAIILVLESRYPGNIPDATPYADALGELLPGIKRRSSTKIVMDEAEQSRYEELHRQASPLIKQAREYFHSRMPEEMGNDAPAARANVASNLKKLSNRHGYTYLGYDDYTYHLQKRLPSGHYICLEFVSTPSSSDADPYIHLRGLGFDHRIWYDGFSPQNPQDAVEYLTQLFQILAEAERSVFPAILDLYPPTPDWFVPTH